VGISPSAMVVEVRLSYIRDGEFSHERNFQIGKSGLAMIKIGRMKTDINIPLSWVSRQHAEILVESRFRTSVKITCLGQHGLRIIRFSGFKMHKMHTIFVKKDHDEDLQKGDWIVISDGTSGAVLTVHW